MPDKNKKKIAIWALTPKGAALCTELTAKMAHVDVFISANLKDASDSFTRFISLSKTFAQHFNAYDSHICIMSTGIVVRILAPLIKHKTVDPAVVVMDEGGRYVISLLSGHLGGANKTAKQIAGLIDAKPVITTATDINNLPSIDVIAKKKRLFIENPDAIKRINMGILTGEKILLIDPFNIIKDSMAKVNILRIKKEEVKDFHKDIPSVYVDDIITGCSANTLILRPASLVAGMGCNKNTDVEELKTFLNDIFKKFRLSIKSLTCIATIDLKKDEPGLLKLGKELQIPVQFYNKEQLNSVKHIKTPSAMVKKHIGVNSVCEAAAILATNQGKLIVNKHKKGNATVAVARIPFTLLE